MKQHALNLLAALALIVVLEIWASDFAYDYASGGFFALIQFGSIPVLLVTSFFRPQKHSGIFIYLLVAAILSIPLNGIVYHSKKAQSIERGKTIVAALESYRARTGGYPSKLSDLVPTDLPQIPSTCMGILDSTQFNYGTDETRTHFRIGFKCPFFLYTSYSTRQSRWITDD